VVGLGNTGLEETVKQIVKSGLAAVGGAIATNQLLVEPYSNVDFVRENPTYGYGGAAAAAALTAYLLRKRRPTVAGALAGAGAVMAYQIYMSRALAAPVLKASTQQSTSRQGIAIGEPTRSALMSRTTTRDSGARAPAITAANLPLIMPSVETPMKTYDPYATASDEETTPAIGDNPYAPAWNTYDPYSGSDVVGDNAGAVISRGGAGGMLGMGGIGRSRK
jgi:hypothetical protein